MRGDVEQIERESFWREHQDTLVRIREELSSGKKSRSKFSPLGGIKRKTPTGVTNASIQGQHHPPYGKYRRTPSPYLPKLNSHEKQNGDLRSNKFDIVPPVKPKVAFTSKVDDYDSWGEDSENEEKDESRNNRGKNKPQPYPSRMQGYLPPSVVYGAPFPLYYPPPPRGAGKNTKSHTKKNSHSNRNNKSYRDMYNNRRLHSSLSSAGGKNKSKSRKNRHHHPTHHSMPMYPTPFMVPMMYPTVPEVEEEDDDDSSDDEMSYESEALRYLMSKSFFAKDFVTGFLNDILDKDILPEMLINFLIEFEHMPYDHPLYVPTLYSCEDFLGDQVFEMVSDVVREVAAEAADVYLDANKGDPLELFLSDLIDDAVRQGTREVVRSAVVDMAEDYLETEVATGIINNMVDDYLDEMSADLFDEVIFDILAEEFIEQEVVIPETHDEATAVARETIQHFDNKVMRREFKTVTTQAQGKLADSIIMDYLLHLMTQQGQLWGEEDHYNKFLDDFMLNTTLTQMFNVQKHRDKTLHSKPLHKLHHKVVSDVALDVFLQQLTRSLDEDMADVDEYERGVTDGVR